MNLPNKLTVLRMVLVPVFVVFMLVPMPIPGNGARYIALVIFIIASLTDMLDGKIARKYNLVTDFGKFMDPLADKLLVTAAMLCLMNTGEIPCWVVIVIIAREFIISGFRLVAVDNGIVIAAGWSGKIKTVCQMVTLIYLLLTIPGYTAWVIGQILIYLSLILTVVSLIDYLVHNKEVLGSAR